jgi:glycine hydroxymethyltransferase
MSESPITLAEYADQGVHRLRLNDPELYRLLEREHRRQARTLAMIAASSVADPSVSACEGSVLGNVTTEGYPGRRFHAGSDVVDDIELLAIGRAKSAFGARYANVQPHSGSTAHQAVMCSRGALLRPGPLRTGLERFPFIRLKQIPRTSRLAVLMCRAVYSASAAGVDEALIVLSTDSGDNVLFADCHPGGA